jgi:hypothetical protein
MPTPDELAALVERDLDERVLVAEAWRLGLDRHDSAVATRLARIGAFVGGGDDSDPRAAVERARALGLDRGDRVLQRYLAERMRQVLARGADHDVPTEADLAAHLAAHAERFALPERVELRHVFLRGAAEPAEDAVFGATLAALPLEEAFRLGDPFPQSRQLHAAPAEIERILGPGFLARLDLERIGAWQGPLPSVYGRHWVLVEGRSTARPATLDEVRARVERDWRAERRRQRLARRLGELRLRYEIERP